MTRAAFVVGVHEFENRRYKPLYGITADIKILQNSFHGMGFPGESITVLKNEPADDYYVTKDEFKTKLQSVIENFKATGDENDCLAIAISSHGQECSVNQGADIPLNEHAVMMYDESVTTQSILDELGSHKHLESVVKLLIVCACRCRDDSTLSERFDQGASVIVGDITEESVKHEILKIVSMKGHSQSAVSTADSKIDEGHVQTDLDSLLIWHDLILAEEIQREMRSHFTEAAWEKLQNILSKVQERVKAQSSPKDTSPQCRIPNLPNNCILWFSVPSGRNQHSQMSRGSSFVNDIFNATKEAKGSLSFMELVTSVHEKVSRRDETAVVEWKDKLHKLCPKSVPSLLHNLTRDFQVII